ncbi:hypothetical protein GTP38_19800 [Duganella sp. FT94W]|uniref:DUF4145 domain-containing protein n=1 Tax=Duganella lactea TaxID=2692173 RepID=A0ABW9VCS7_9BURK|nr:hypothetical protein [Duganella lactea]MYM36577.1 hypothetical protein [Duganella lactea]
MKNFKQSLKVAIRLLSQSWIPAVMALIYAIWEMRSANDEQRTAANLVHSWGVTFFLISWFTGQWFRTSKQISDAEQLGVIQQSLDKQLGLLQEITEVALNEASPIMFKSDSEITGNESIKPPNEDAIARVLAEIPRSPKGALLVLGAELERELRQLLWSSGWVQSIGKTTITRSVEHLVTMGVVPKNLGSSVKAFLDVRNRLLHGYGVTEDEVLRAIDIGLTILRAVLVIPQEHHEIYHPGVDVFEDADATSVRPDVKAVVLKAISPGASTYSLKIYPTVRTNFVKGQRVSWEWDMDSVIDESWYRHPDTGAVQYGWGMSAAFAGRSLDEV